MAHGVDAAVGWQIADLVFRADGTLWRNGQLVHLTPLQRRLLLTFCHHAGQLLPREVLVEAVWKRQHVSDQSLARAIHSLRRVLDAIGIGGDRIVTVYGGGYTFSVGVTPLSRNPWEPSRASVRPVEERPGDASALAQEHHAEGVMLLRLNHPDLVAPALQHLQRCLELTEHGDAARLDLGWLLLQQAVWGLEPGGSCARLITELVSAAEASGSRCPGLLQLQAESLSLLEWKPRQAERLYRRQEGLDLGRSQALLSWCRHLLATGRPQQAHDLLVPHLQRELPFGWLLAGIARLNLLDADGALSALRRLLTIRPLQASTNLVIALLLGHLGETETALDLLETAAGSAGAQLLRHRIPPVRAYVLAMAGRQTTAHRILDRVNLDQAPLPQPCLWALAALACDHPQTARLWRYGVSKRCYAAPFVLHSPLLASYDDHPVVLNFRAAMGDAFLEPAWDELLVG